MVIARKKRPLLREKGDFRDASLCIVATEGEKTEPLYFGVFRGKRVKVIPLPCENGRSSPDAVLEAITQYRERYQLNGGDSFWIVIDRDAWTIEMLTSVYATGRRAGVSIAISNPFFEIWLALHFADLLPADLSKRSIASHLRGLLGSFNKGNFPSGLLMPNVASACARARALDIGTNEVWPDAPGSRVYQLIEELLAKEREPFF